MLQKQAPLARGVIVQNKVYSPVPFLYSLLQLFFNALQPFGHFLQFN